MAMLSWARLAVRALPFKRWSQSLGCPDRGGVGEAEARRLTNLIEHAADRLPVETKCLPRAMALSWLLRRRRIGHEVVIAVRPAQLRDSPDALHAWVEVGGAKIIGDLPGPWLETLRLGGSTLKSRDRPSTGP